MSESSPTSDTLSAPPGKGTSLGQDAWRRLRRNRVAMACLCLLITITLLAFFTPLLPLAPPDQHHTELQYEPPKLQPLFDRSFSLDWKAIDAAPYELADARAKLLSLQSESPSSATQADIRRLQNEIRTILYRPVPRCRLSRCRPREPMDDSHAVADIRRVDARFARRPRRVRPR